MTGGSGADIFDFNDLFATKNESKKGAGRDVITDFEGAGVDGGDIIDLRTVDANDALPGNRFKFIGDNAFHHKAGELHIKAAGAGVFLVEGDINGDGRADFQIEVHSVAALTKGDFIL